MTGLRELLTRKVAGIPVWVLFVAGVVVIALVLRHRAKSGAAADNSGALVGAGSPSVDAGSDGTLPSAGVVSPTSGGTYVDTTSPDFADAVGSVVDADLAERDQAAAQSIASSLAHLPAALLKAARQMPRAGQVKRPAKPPAKKVHHPAKKTAAKKKSPVKRPAPARRRTTPHRPVKPVLKR